MGILNRRVPPTGIRAATKRGSFPGIAPTVGAYFAFLLAPKNFAYQCRIQPSRNSIPVLGRCSCANSLAMYPYWKTWRATIKYRRLGAYSTPNGESRICHPAIWTTARAAAYIRTFRLGNPTWGPQDVNRKPMWATPASHGVNRADRPDKIPTRRYFTPRRKRHISV